MKIRRDVRVPPECLERLLLDCRGRVDRPHALEIVRQPIGQQVLELVRPVDVVRAVRVDEVLGSDVRLIVREDRDRG